MNSNKISNSLNYINANRNLNKTSITKIIRCKILKIKLKSECRKRNAFISTSTIIGKNIIFPHGINGVFISQGAIIGDNVVVFHHVTIGSNTLKDSKGYGAPKIGNNVYIGAGAKIIGNVKIGDNVRIGANVAITTDIPNNSTVIMGEVRVLKHKVKKNNMFYPYINT